MARRETGEWSRRDMMKAAALVVAVAGGPVSARAVLRTAVKGGPALSHRLLLREVCQLVLPRTATAGAGEAGVGDFVALGLAHGLHGALAPVNMDADPLVLAHRRADGSLDHLGWLAADLDRRVAGAFMQAPPARRQAALAALDAQAFANAGADHPWRTIKTLVLIGYYTSAIGGSQELRYEAVPGRFDPDLPLTAQTRAISNDWSAIDFG